MSVPEQSMITDEHRALIGLKSEPTTVLIKEVDAHRMRDILGDKDPRWADETGLAAPYAISSYGARPGNMPRILPGGLMTQQEWRFIRPFKLDEPLQAISQVVDIKERLGGRYGYSILVTVGTDYYDGDGNHVATSMATLTQFDPKGASKE